MKKIHGSWIIKQILKKLFIPRYFIKFLQHLRNKKNTPTSYYNAQLELYKKILPGDFLHYGYFDNPSTPPEEISIQDIHNAQLRYAELLVEQIEDVQSPVLDAGCGMGGLLNLLIEKGISPVGLTPDRIQIQYLEKKYSEIPLINSKFEKIPIDSYQHYFGTVIHSESLQYMKLDTTITNVKQILKPDGRWIVADYFRIGKSRERSGFQWDTFVEKLEIHELNIQFQRDITPNISPTLAYIYMLGNKIGKPVYEFATHKFEKKHPAIHYLLEDVVSMEKKILTRKLEYVNPEVFSQNKKYMILTIVSK